MGYAQPSDWFAGNGISVMPTPENAPIMCGFHILTVRFVPSMWSRESVRAQVSEYLFDECKATDVRFKLVKGMADNDVIAYWR